MHTLWKALLLFLLLLSRGSELLIVTSQRPDHILVQSVLISSDHTHSCLSYCLHLRSIIGWVHPHIWHALKTALICLYAQKMHMHIFQIQKVLLSVFHQSAHSCFLCNIRQKFKGIYILVHWVTWSIYYFPITGDHIFATNITFLHLCLITWGRQLCWEQTDLLRTGVEIAAWIIHIFFYSLSPSFTVYNIQ